MIIYLHQLPNAQIAGALLNAANDLANMMHTNGITHARTFTRQCTPIVLLANNG